MNLDVLHVRHFEQRLQPAVAEHRILDCSDVRLLLSRRPEFGTAAVQGTNMISNYTANDGAAQQEPVIGPERTTVPSDLLLDLVGDHLGRDGEAQQSEPSQDHL